jgi:hypothetical protein
MAKAKRASVAAGGNRLVEPPIIDTLVYDDKRRGWDILVIPEQAVSTREKEGVFIPARSADGARVRLRLDRLSKLVGLRVERIFHAGGGNFIFIDPEERRFELSEPHGEIDLSLRAYVELTDIAMTAQIAFLTASPKQVAS